MDRGTGKGLAIAGLVVTMLAAIIGILPAVGVFDGGSGNGGAPPPATEVAPAPAELPRAPVNPAPAEVPRAPVNAGPAEFPAADRPDIYLSDTAAPSGKSVRVSGEGFDPGETVVIRVHTDEVARTEVSDSGGFANVSIIIPRALGVFAPKQFDVVATGQDSVRSARRPITVSG